MKWLHKIAVLLVCTLPLTGCDPFVSQIPTMNEFMHKTPQEIYQQAKIASIEKRYNAAIKNFTAFLALYNDHQFAGDAYVELVYCYTYNKQFKAAFHMLDILQNSYPEHHKNTIKLKEFVFEMQQAALQREVNKLALNSILLNANRGSRLVSASLFY